MTVYVDDVSTPFRDRPVYRMASAELGELHTLARRIGLEEEWFQDGLVPHYIVSPEMKSKALKAGARETDSRALLLVMSRRFTVDGGESNDD